MINPYDSSILFLLILFNYLDFTINLQGDNKT